MSKMSLVGFESRHRILDGQFLTYFIVKIVMFALKDIKINNKRGRGWPIFLKKNRAGNTKCVIDCAWSTLVAGD